jgi:hypothetical protein
MMRAIPLILVIVLVIAAAVAAWALFISRGRRRPSGAVCGACGYSVVGLTSMICPECGGDLRQVGILTPHTPRQGGSLVGGALLFTALLGFVAIEASAALYSVLPQRRTYSQHLRLLTPKSGAYREVHFGVEGIAWAKTGPDPAVEIELVPNVGAAGTATSPPRLRLIPDGGYEYVGPGSARVAKPGRFGATAVLEWLKTAGIDTSLQAAGVESAHIAGEANMFARAARRAMASPNSMSGSFGSSGGNAAVPFNSSTLSTNFNRQPPSWTLIPIGLFWLAVWIGGLRYLSHGVRYSS